MTLTDQNRAMLLRLYDAVVKRDWDQVKQLLVDDFVEHNPRVPHDPARGSGREAFIAYFAAGQTPLDGAKVEIRRIIADEAHAVVHYKLTNAAHPLGVAVVDIFKAEGGRFTEHWDVLQPIEPNPANPHGAV